MPITKPSQAAMDAAQTLLEVRKAGFEPSVESIARFLDRAMNAPLSFEDSVKIARGCHDYGGGYHSPTEAEIFHHGIQTVINSLEAAQARGLADTQVAVLHRTGSSVAKPPS